MTPLCGQILPVIEGQIDVLGKICPSPRSLRAGYRFCALVKPPCFTSQVTAHDDHACTVLYKSNIRKITKRLSWLLLKVFALAHDFLTCLKQQYSCLNLNPSYSDTPAFGFYQFSPSFCSTHTTKTWSIERESQTRMILRTGALI